jgi:site-specific recombinase XerC
MSYMPPAGADRRLPRSHLLVLNRSFRRALEAENKSPRTMQADTDAVRLLAAYCESHGHPPPGQPDGRHATAQLPEQPVDVVRPEHLARLLKTCEGRDVTSRRDTAIILLLVDTGMRRAEFVGMTLDDVDLDQRIVWVLGKGRRPRALPIGRKTALALGRYLTDARRPPAGPPGAPVVGRNGPITPRGSTRSSAIERGPRGYRRCIPVSSGMPPPPVGSPKVATRTS